MPSICSSTNVVPAVGAADSLVVTASSPLRGDGVPGLVHGGTDRRGIDRIGGDDDEATRLQIDLDLGDSRDLRDLLLHGGDAVAAGHAGDGEGCGGGHGVLLVRMAGVR